VVVWTSWGEGRPKKIQKKLTHTQAAVGGHLRNCPKAQPMLSPAPPPPSRRVSPKYTVSQRNSHAGGRSRQAVITYWQPGPAPSGASVYAPFTLNLQRDSLFSTAMVGFPSPSAMFLRTAHNNSSPCRSACNVCRGLQACVVAVEYWYVSPTTEPGGLTPSLRPPPHPNPPPPLPRSVRVHVWVPVDRAHVAVARDTRCFLQMMGVLMFWNGMGRGGNSGLGCS
jgi:hypothetical protein